MPAASRPRVLLIAEAANPEWASVPLVGWSHSQAIAEVTDAHLVTHHFNGDAIARLGWVEGKDFTGLDLSAIEKRVNRWSSLLRGGAGKGWTTVMALSAITYYFFEQQFWQQFGPRLAAGEFDLVHRITPLSPTIPSQIARRCQQIGVPFILGPLNGGLPWPKAFDATRRQEKEWLSYIRDVYKLLPGYRSTRDCAAAIVVGSRATWSQMPARYHDKCIYIPENAIDPQRFALQRTRSLNSPLKAIFVGRLVPYKGVDMLLEATAPLIRTGQLTLEVVGDGPEMPRLRDMVTSLGIEQGVELAGNIPHTQVQERLVNADLFVFPSIREFGGAVVIEAMAMGLVPIVVDYGGPGELVNPETGYLVPMGDRQQIIDRFQAILTRLVQNPQPLAAMGQRARQRVLDLFTWPAKAQQTLEVYRWVLEPRSNKPDFGMPMRDRIATIMQEVAG